jgi:hypothetical protein
MESASPPSFQRRRYACQHTWRVTALAAGLGGSNDLLTLLDVCGILAPHGISSTALH